MFKLTQGFTAGRTWSDTSTSGDLHQSEKNSSADIKTQYLGTCTDFECLQMFLGLF